MFPKKIYSSINIFIINLIGQCDNQLKKDSLHSDIIHNEFETGLLQLPMRPWIQLYEFRRHGLPK